VPDQVSLRPALTPTGAQEVAALPLATLMDRAAALRDSGHDDRISYSKKVFIPLTRLCRDVCSYCTFATTPGNLPSPYLTPDEVLAIAQAGAAAGCKEALFTLGDKPELRYQAARDALAALGHATTIEYLAAMCRLVFDETGLLPHANPGAMTRDEIELLRPVTVSQGMMLESISARLCAPGGPHHGSPDKEPAARLATLQAAGEARVPLTTGILIGIGETRDERIDALFAIRDSHDAFGHIQETIIQNFRAKPDTRMADSDDATLDDLLWTVAMARLILGAEANIQAPPNLSPEDYPQLIAAGINDWGGISPVTRDHVNPEAPWPEIEALSLRTAEANKTLVERLAIYPDWAQQAGNWLAPEMATAIRHRMVADGLARIDDWTPGVELAVPETIRFRMAPSADLCAIIERATDGARLDEVDIVRLFSARDADFDAVCDAANQLRVDTVGDVVTYAVNRNINYTNICTYRCTFCAFSKGRGRTALRGPAYNLDLDEIAARVVEAEARGATEVCLQGGIHPDFTGDTYLEICRAVKQAAPGIHVHAFSPLEISHGASTLGLSVEAFLVRLVDAGLGSLPGTAAEILDDEMRAILCPDKLSTSEWLSVIETAHGIGLRTTATIMYGAVEAPVHWARHLLHLRDLQQRTGGLTEFVPLPFVHMEAPIFRQGLSRKGPDWREAILMHAVARLALHPLIPNIQASWVKMGPVGMRACLDAGVNDLGGTLMNESISSAAGASFGQEFDADAMRALALAAGRIPQQRGTLYQQIAQGPAYAAAE
jgi:FO synthase